MRPVAPLLLLAAALAPVAHAQVLSIYGTYSPTHFSNVLTGTILTPQGSAYNYTSPWTNNFGGGVTIGVLPVGPIHIGLDLRGSTHANTVGSDTAMAGIRVGFKPPVLPIKPYVQASGGYAATRTYNVSSGAPAGSTFTNQYAAYEIIGGVDYKFLPILDLRLIEIGGGRGYAVTGVQQQVPIFTLNTGVVLHF